MFSYISTKNTQSTIEQNLIEQIQFLANEIFDSHAVSVTRTEQQQISLELSPATSEDNLDLQQQPKEIYQEVKKVKEFEQMNYFTNILNNQKPFHHSKNKNKQQLQLVKQSAAKQHDQPTRRLAKSMLAAQNLFKQPGSFSNSYMPNKNISASQVSPLLSKQLHFKDTLKQKQRQRDNTQPQPLNVSSMSKSNILMGVLKQAKPINSKTPTKKGKFSSSYASNYLSPYSTRGIKENPKSYMQKSNSRTKQSRQTAQIQYIKQRINQNIEPQLSYKKEKAQQQRLKNPKLSNVKSKYKQARPLMHQYHSYAEQHIYKKMKTEMAAWEEKKKQHQMFSSEEIQNNWQEFIKGEENFLEQKKQWRASKRLQNMQRQQMETSPSPIKNMVVNGKGLPIKVTPPKMTPEDFVKKYKRQKQKLKQKLEANEVSNFMQKSFQESKKYGKQIFDNKWGSSFTNKDIEAVYVEGFSALSGVNHDEKKISQLLISQTIEQGKIRNENFFISVGEQSQKEYQKKKNNASVSFRPSKNFLSKSSIYEDKLRANKSTSKEPKSSYRKQSNSKGRQNISSLSPFIKKSNYLSKQQSSKIDNFDPRKHNLPQFNQQITEGRQKSNSKKTVTKSNKKISELLNPKYFKSINELEQYSSNSRSRERKQNMKRTFENNKNNSYESNSLIKIQGNNINGNNGKKPQQFHSDRKGLITGFDHKLMSRIMEDLDLMRSEIQENKKKRKYKIQNYRNFSNVRNSQEEPNQRTGSFMYEDAQNEEREHKNNFAHANKRENHHFINNQTQKSQQINFQQINLHHSRSVSPIQQQDSIINQNHNLSLSVIHPTPNQHIQVKNSNLQQFNSRIANSNMILVKSQQEVQFILKDKQMTN